MTLQRRAIKVSTGRIPTSREEEKNKKQNKSTTTTSLFCFVPLLLPPSDCDFGYLTAEALPETRRATRPMEIIDLRISFS